MWYLRLQMCTIRKKRIYIFSTKWSVRWFLDYYYVNSSKVSTFMEHGIAPRPLANTGVSTISSSTTNAKHPNPSVFPLLLPNRPSPLISFFHLSNPPTTSPSPKGVPRHSVANPLSFPTLLLHSPWVFSYFTPHAAPLSCFLVPPFLAVWTPFPLQSLVCCFSGNLHSSPKGTFSKANPTTHFVCLCRC